ncbi:MAG: glycerol-3-phosphate dehydrogenase/oxidase [Ilumatobacteraceae bacterium]|jgi:glycerol-3-phosphate dehydrogenase|nr:glycerol-3-phosphate dehydrogenase/oxidase [Ilumatobacteraceae bacterium]
MRHQADFSRSTSLQRLSSEEFDLVVVGGGITGAGVALDAASRGLSVALLERDDFASGTSSKSSKLIHGGLRYLQQGDVRLVYEALRERKRLRRNAPHLVHVLPFMIPILTKDGVVSKKIARALGSAMWMYDLTGGWRIGKLHRRLSAKKAFAHLPTMEQRKLASAYLYYDAEADDARLCLTVLKTAADNGAAIANRCRVDSIQSSSRTSHEVSVTDTVAGTSFVVRAKCVVSAAGVWADDVRSLDENTHPDTIRPAKGVHLTVPWEKVRNDIAVVIPVPRDRRSLFVVPWISNGDGTYKFTYIGTTDTDYKGPVDDPQCTKDDIDYVLAALNASVTTNVTVDDVTAVWSGLRPLVKTDDSSAKAGRTADLSRRHKVFTSENGVITVTGGKLTTYREMAEDAVDEACSILGRKASCKTKRLALRGANGKRNQSTVLDQHLDGRFGSDASHLRQLMTENPSLAEELVPGLPYLKCEAVYAVTHEMATTLDDILTRRTRARLLDRRACKAVAPAVADLVAPYLKWDSATRDHNLAHFIDECAREDAAGLVTETEFIASTTKGTH